MIELADLQIDVDLFEEAIHSNHTTSGKTMIEHEKAVKLYQGDYLQGLDYIWAENERERLKLLWFQTVTKMVDWYRQKGPLEKALELSLEVSNRYPLEEEGALFLMKTLADMGQHAQVERIYTQFSQLLKKELNLTPSANMTHWYEEWKRRIAPESLTFPTDK